MQLKALRPSEGKLLRVLAGLQAAGFRAWLAGGCVRDALLGRPSKDVDIVTDASVEEIQEIFPRTVAVGASFGVVLVLEGDEEFEVAQFRKESDYRDGRRPSLVEPASPEEDAWRRDLTVNALFYDPQSGTLYDFVDGLQDLRSKTLRAVGRANVRFNEDHLRILRAIRFKAQLRFDWDSDLERAIREDVNLLSKVSRERIRDELLKMSLSPGWESLVPFLIEAGILRAILPGLEWVASAHRPLNARSDEEVWWEWGLWALRSGNDLPGIQSAFASLRLSRAESRSLEHFLFWFQDPPAWQNQAVGALVERSFAPGSRAGFRVWKTLDPAWAGSAKIEALFEKFPEPPAPLVRAEDLPGVRGAELGRTLREVYHRQLESAGADRDELLRFAKSRSGPASEGK